MNYKSILSIFILSLVFIGFSKAQNITVKGKIIDATNGSPLAFANIGVVESGAGTTSDENGNYSIELDFSAKESYTLSFTFIGFDEIKKTVTASDLQIDITLEPSFINGAEVVISGSRVAENILQSPVSIQKVNSQQIVSSAGGNFYDGFRNLRGVDINTSSAGFQAINMRGFNNTSPVRVVQFVDGMDNQAPGLNFPVGNLVGAGPLDIESVEIITGPASALYGANAFQGVVNMITKNPYDYQGLDVEIKGGSRDWIEGNFRFAKAFGKEKKLAVKLTGSYLSMQDWIADDEIANRYGDISAEVNLSSIVSQQQYNQNLSQADRDQWVALNNYI